MLYHTGPLFAQTDYCNRISALKVEQPDSGYTTYISPRVNEVPVDKKQAFFKQFHRRFDYILINKVNVDGADLYKGLNDTAALNRRFCELFMQQKELSGYFDVLSNAQKGTKQMFTIEEMMQVASRFFWLDNRKQMAGSIIPVLAITVKRKAAIKRITAYRKPFVLKRYSVAWIKEKYLDSPYRPTPILMQ